MPSFELVEWGYSTVPPIKILKCRVHGIVVAMIKMDIHNKEYEIVSDRRYCAQCFDQFLQQHLDPLVEASLEDIKQWRNQNP